MKQREINQRLTRNPFIKNSLNALESIFIIAKVLVFVFCIVALWEILKGTVQTNEGIIRIEHYLKAHDPGYSIAVIKPSPQVKIG